uniref:Uncharacterized protein n=1 Tax=Arcella intermedia TaxID=1963864 RepID=A0A6B2LVL2_9EUKA
MVSFFFVEIFLWIKLSICFISLPISLYSRSRLRIVEFDLRSCEINLAPLLPILLAVRERVVRVELD